MSVVTVSDLQAHLGNVADDGSFQVYVDQAEAAVAAYIGADDLAELSVNPTAFVTLEADSNLLLPELAGPMALIVTVTDAVTAEAIFPVSGVSMLLPSPWMTQLLDTANHSRVFAMGQTISLVFKQGYTKDTMPAAMRMAILNTAQWIEERPAGGVASETIGDYAYTLRQAPGSLEQVLPASAIAQLAKLRRPDFDT